MDMRSMTTARLPAFVLATLALIGTASAAGRPVSLSQQPLVMRLSKDEFRIAFGITAAPGAGVGCDGAIRYRVDWQAEDGLLRSENRLVSYSVAPQSNRTIAVDRQYFDTAEGKHTTEVVRVRVDSINCVDAVANHGAQIAAAG